MLTRRNPTLNRLQNLLLHQRNLEKLQIIQKQRLQHSFVLAKLRMLASPRLNRVKTSLLSIPRTRTFRFFVAFPFFCFGAMHTQRYFKRTFVTDSESKDGGATGGNPGVGKKWYQIKKVQGLEGTYNFLGFEI